MTDFNDIFGYKVYKPPPEKDLPVVQDLNVVGEVITLIDPSADVIKDPAVQKILKSLDGERTVKIEDLPPDVRYDGWNKKAQYDNQVITRNAGNRQNLEPQLPVVHHNLLKDDGNSHQYQQEALKQAQLKAQQAKKNELEFSRQLQETKIALEKEIHRQLVEQLTLRAQKKSVTPEQQALIEKLYLDLRLINPELAFATLKASATLYDPNQQQAYVAPVPQVQRAPHQSHQPHQSNQPYQSHQSHQPHQPHSEPKKEIKKKEPSNERYERNERHERQHHRSSRREETHHSSSKHGKSSKSESRHYQDQQLVYNQGSIMNADGSPIRLTIPKISTKSSKSSSRKYY